jgi:glutamate N-acetyltransferase/amino-acid N-acetyltransferase
MATRKSSPPKSKGSQGAKAKAAATPLRKPAAKTSDKKKDAKPAKAPAKPVAVKPVKAQAKSKLSKPKTAKPGPVNSAAKKPAASAPPPVGQRKAKAHPVSPLAPAGLPELPPIKGVRIATGAAGVRYAGRTDVTLAVFAPGTTVAGVLTRSKCPSAPVDWCRQNLNFGRARALVVNSGNANAFTGAAGAAAARATAHAAADLIHCKPEEVFLASTGVIGEVLPADKIVSALPFIHGQLGNDSFAAAARAIMTTDTYPKAASAIAEIDGVKVTINGIAKGSGMIAPDLATMLSFVFTDALLPADVLQTLLILGTQNSFNSITVDGDTSTSDTVLFFATGTAAHEPVRRAGDPRLADFREKLNELLLDLAIQVVCDGEGAQKLIQVRVEGAASPKAARTIALSIANSPLVKTAIAGGDANWGRVVMAVGKSGEAAERDKLMIRFGGQPVAKNGLVDPDYDEAAAGRHVKGQKVDILVDVGVGLGAATVWTCDLTHGYIDINADYRS